MSTGSNNTGLNEEQNQTLTYFDNNLIQHATPSQKRYIQYYLQILCEKMGQEDHLVHLHSVVYSHEATQPQETHSDEGDEQQDEQEGDNKDIKSVFLCSTNSLQSLTTGFPASDRNSHKGGCIFIKIYQNLNLIYTSQQM
ncbi:hypothetical protein Ciccas_013570 [Cichlidogyrus casuarinus]|uniref:Uncharacterized protein n=1 Tax=Cichlidogyrus casuarinus TaxID=1844966 RepID=A0ABD2PKB9_9PLAT